MTNKSNPLLGWEMEPLPVNNDKPIKEFLTIFNSDPVKNLSKNLSHGGMTAVRLLDILNSYGYTTPSDYEFDYSHSYNIFSTAPKSVFRLRFYSNKEVPIVQMMMQVALQLEVNVIDVTEFLQDHEEV